MAEMETEHIKKMMKKQDDKYKKYMQIATKNESEGLKKTLELRSKERDMYKDELEKFK